MTRRRNLQLLLWLLIILLVGCIAAWKTFETLTMRSLAKREKRLMPLAEAAASRYGVNPALVKAVIWRESRWQPLAVGAKGEIGLMQITPGAVADWQRVNQKNTPIRAQLFQAEINIEIGTWYLAQAGKHWQNYRSKEILQLAEYNAGYGRVSKLWKPQHPEQEVTLEEISFPGTRDYIMQILIQKSEYEKR